MGLEEYGALTERLARIEETLTLLLRQRTVKEWYTTAEVAALLHKAEYTVREWCRLSRIHSEKLPHGRGNEGEWRIAHEELVRYDREGLLPLPRKY